LDEAPASGSSAFRGLIARILFCLKNRPALLSTVIWTDRARISSLTPTRQSPLRKTVLQFPPPERKGYPIKARQKAANYARRTPQAHARCNAIQSAPAPGRAGAACSRYCDGVSPVHPLNSRLKYLTSAYPIRSQTSCSFSPGSRSSSFARSIRWRVT